MDARTLARLHAAGRVAFGGCLTVAPAVLTGPWIGAAADGAGGRVIAQAMGARDLAIGLGALRAAGKGRGARPWVLAGMLADAADMVATLRARGALPPAAPLVAAIAGGSVALGAWLQRAVD